ncbi:hypothetical protein DBB29_25000 [Pandoraea cepalis]|uniref:Uncharacterized protein n=1 Tax=Pandoraea cepalis TaxID=2508294 RepID=A0AAW7MGP9_9BURK|nr:hypothetical protein [Pandoraea cepalis]MDN4581375.1 hypothetical protein [Pandoraea cepalis]
MDRHSLVAVSFSSQTSAVIAHFHKCIGMRRIDDVVSDKNPLTVFFDYPDFIHAGAFPLSQ